MESTGSDSGLIAEGAIKTSGLTSGSVPLSTTTGGRTFLDSDWNILVKECSSLAAKWRTVSTYLGLPKEVVDQIEADYSKSVERCWSEALSKWVQQNAPADVYGLPSWSTLLKAIVIVDPSLARKLASKYQCSLVELTSQSPPTMDENKPSQDVSETKPLAVAQGTTKVTQPRSETGAEMVRSNIDEINALFTTLLQNVQDALQASSDVKVVWDFLINFFRCSLPDTDDMKQLFQSVTLRNLWSYECYSPLEKLAKRFVPGNKEVGRLMTEYRARLSGFYLTTKIIDFMDYRHQLSTTDSLDDSPPKLLPEQYKKIKIKLNLKRRISELSLDYVHNLWVAFAEEFEIPSLTVILEEITRGSLEVTWVVPTAFVEMIKPRSRFFRRLGITQVLVDGRVLYDENQMADKEKQFLQLCYKGTTPIHKFTSLLTEGVDPDLYDKSGFHPLWYATYYGRLDLVELFLRYGASVDLATQDEYGQTTLWTAARHGHTDLARHLLDHGATVDLPNTDTFGETPLFAACAGGHKATAALLVERGAAINYQRKSSGNTPLYVASQVGHVELVSLLLEKGADLNKGQQPPLYAASGLGHVDVVKVLVDRGADVNKRTDGEIGPTPLITACYENQLEVARLLIDRGADVNLQNKNRGSSSLHIASQLGHTAIVQLLLHSKAQLELRNKEGRTALMVASWRGHLKAVVELLRAGALTDSQDQEGLTALILATQNKHSDVVDALLEFKADLNIIENTAGWSALFFAVKSGNLEIVKRLIREGANVEMRDKNGLTAAEISDDEVICEELKQHSLCTVEPVIEVQTSQEEQDDTSTDVSQSDHEDSQSKKLMTEDQKKETDKDSEGDSGEREQESKGHVQQQDTQEKKRDLVKRSYQKLLRIFDVLEDSLLPGRKEKREYQKKKETPSNITEANQQMYEELNT